MCDLGWQCQQSSGETSNIPALVDKTADKTRKTRRKNLLFKNLDEHNGLSHLVNQLIKTILLLLHRKLPPYQ